MAQASERVMFRIDKELLAKAKEKSKKMCCKSVQDYFTYLIQRDLFTGHGGGRPKNGGGFNDIEFLTSKRPVFKEEPEWDRIRRAKEKEKALEEKRKEREAKRNKNKKFKLFG